MHSQTRFVFAKAPSSKVASVSAVLRRPMLQEMFESPTFMQWLRAQWPRKAWLRKSVLRAFRPSEHWKFQRLIAPSLRAIFYQYCRATQFKSRQVEEHLSKTWQDALVPFAAAPASSPTDAQRLVMAFVQHAMRSRPNFWSLPAAVFDQGVGEALDIDVSAVLQWVDGLLQAPLHLDDHEHLVFFRVTNAQPELKTLVQIHHQEKCRTFANVVRYKFLQSDGHKIILDEGTEEDCKLDLMKVCARPICVFDIPWVRN